MAKKQERKRNLAFKIVVALFAVCSVWQIIDIQISIVKTEQQREEIEALLVEQRLENKDIKALLEQRDDPDHIEKIAREQLGFAYPDERVYVDTSGS